MGAEEGFDPGFGLECRAGISVQGKRPVYPWQLGPAAWSPEEPGESLRALSPVLSGQLGCLRAIDALSFPQVPGLNTSACVILFCLNAGKPQIC